MQQQADSALQRCFAAMGRADTRSGYFGSNRFGHQLCTREFQRPHLFPSLQHSLPPLLGTPSATEREAPSSSTESTEPARGFALAIAFAPGQPAPVDA
jgi:hypothetical protein